MDGDRSGYERRYKGTQLKPREVFDYVLLVSVVEGVRHVMAEKGEPCKGAANTPCLSRLQTLRESFQPWAAKCEDDYGCPGPSFVLTTRGAEVQAWSTPAELVRLLAPIDTVAEAWLLAHATLAAYPSYVCDNADFSAFRTIADGFEVRERRYTARCKPVIRSEFVFRVSTEGVASMSRSKLGSSDNECIGGVQEPQGDGEVP